MIRSQASTANASPIPEPPRRGSLVRDVFASLDNRLRRIPEVRVAIAVLEDAVRCIERGHGSRQFQARVDRREAERWIASRARTHVFTFENICALLRISPEETRDRIHSWRDRFRAACHS
ncbi:MAG TPA: hypothetical protein VFQ07_12825 [Candidatus Polarisedimenticolia bacterium]|nr:hypothetical protein [Candidatus Polarisedimenticolia bacterium]